MRLIEADALKEILDKIPAQSIENVDGRAYVLIRLSTVFEIIKQMPSALPEINKQELIRIMNTGIIATNTEDVYSCGMRNGIRWCRALLEDDPPKFEDASQYAEPERKNGRWINKPDLYGVAYCSECDFELHINDTPYCPNCGADMRGEQND